MRTGSPFRTITFCDWRSRWTRTDGVSIRRRARAASSALQGLLLSRGQSDAADLPDALLPEVVPLPAVELRAEPGHQAEARGDALRRECVQQGGEPQGLRVEVAAELPGGVAEGEEVLIPEVLHDEEPALRIVADDRGNGHTDLPEEAGNPRVVVVLLAQAAVAHEDEGIAAGNGAAEVVAVRSAPPHGSEGEADLRRQAEGRADKGRCLLPRSVTGQRRPAAADSSTFAGGPLSDHPLRYRSSRIVQPAFDPRIRLRVADILPGSLIDHDASDRTGRLPDHCHEDRNDRLDLAGRQPPEEPLLHHVDPREEAAPDAGIPEEIPDIADGAFGIDGDVRNGSPAPQGEGDLLFPQPMGPRSLPRGRSETMSPL